MSRPSGYCPKCGKVRTGDRFCANCGNDFWRGGAEEETEGLVRSEAAARPAPPPLTGSQRRHWTATSYGFIAAGAGLVVAPFLPYMTATDGFNSLARTGIEMTGAEAFLLSATGGLLIAVGIQQASGTVVGRLLPIAASLVAGGLTLGYYGQVDNRLVAVSGDVLEAASVGTGLWLALGASVVGLLLSVRHATRSGARDRAVQR